MRTQTRIETEELTDGSFVYNIILADDDGLDIARIGCVDYETAQNLAAMLIFRTAYTTRL